jgi:hypothetical protein
MPSHRKPFPLLGALGGLFTLPSTLLSGFVTGLVSPVASIAAMVALVRFATGRVPYLSEIAEEGSGERHLVFRLMSVQEAKELFDLHKEQIGGEIAHIQADIQAIAQEAKDRIPG